MTGNVVAVNTKEHNAMPNSIREASTYHHGDLRAALIDAAVALIAEHGVQGLSLRECARRAGVSHAAPYRHFAEKNDLLLAIAQQGFGWLAEAGRAAMTGVTGARERLEAYGVAYVRFAVTHPVHHRVMFSEALGGPHTQKGDEPSFQLLVEAATQAVGPDDPPLLAAVSAWSLPHGLAMLILDGRIPPELVRTPDDAERLAREVFAMWRSGLR
jgi:AcrR family transcriptional regulator